YGSLLPHPIQSYGLAPARSVLVRFFYRLLSRSLLLQQFKHSLVFSRTLAIAFAFPAAIVTAHPYQGPDEEDILDGFKDKPDEQPQPQQQQRQE
ncbi:hypothetical protein BGZ97_007398, partial [Linnemannia gamsii]